MNAVPSGVEGEIVEICVENGEAVEYGQVLMRVSPR
jgi:biotin carboxyl carrier protein